MNSRKIKMRLRTKLALLITALILAVMLPLSFVFSARDARMKEEDMRRQSADIAKLVAQIQVMSALTSKPIKTRTLQNYLTLAMSIDSSIAYIVMTDAQDRLIAGKLNPEFVDSEVSGSEKEQLESLTHATHGTESDLRAISVEIIDNNRRFGRVKMGFSLQAMKREIREDLIKNFLLTLILVLLGVTASYVFAHRISKPIETLVKAMQQVRDGNFDTRVSIRNQDEVGLLAESFNVMTQGLKEREWIKMTFSRYVSRQVAEKILSDKKDIDFNGELRNVTILFADIRGFTPLAEHLSPREVVALLNTYFDMMIDIIFKYEGTLDKFIGDQVMAVYGAPLNQDMPELRAVKTALEMQQAVTALNERRARSNQTTVQIGIGINTGEVVAGNIGSEKRMEYTVIGDEVNTAQRIEAATPKNQVLISESTYQAVKEDVEVTPLPETMVKGRKEPIKLYSVLRLKS